MLQVREIKSSIAETATAPVASLRRLKFGTHLMGYLRFSLPAEIALKPLHLHSLDNGGQLLDWCELPPPSPDLDNPVPPGQGRLVPSPSDVVDRVFEVTLSSVPSDSVHLRLVGPHLVEEVALLLPSTSASVDSRSLPTYPSNASAHELLVGGAAKSGTTWISAILNSCCDAVVLNEPPLDAGLIPTRLGWDSDALYSEFVSAVASDLALLQPLGYTAYGAKFPEIARWAASWLLADSRRRYVHALRNPLDVVVSRVFHEVALLDTVSDTEGKPSEIETAIQQTLSGSISATTREALPLSSRWVVSAITQTWIDQTQSMLALAEQRNPQVFVLTYEGLTLRGSKEVKKLLEFLDLNPLQSDRAVSATDVEALRGKHGHPYYRSGKPDDWRNWLPPEQATFIVAMLDAEYPIWRELTPVEF